MLWTIDVDAEGATTAIDVRRALVRSRAQLTYQQVQDQLDDGAGAAGGPATRCPPSARS